MSRLKKKHLKKLDKFRPPVRPPVTSRHSVTLQGDAFEHRNAFGRSKAFPCRVPKVAPKLPADRELGCNFWHRTVTRLRGVVWTLKRPVLLDRKLRSKGQDGTCGWITDSPRFSVVLEQARDLPGGWNNF